MHLLFFMIVSVVYCNFSRYEFNLDAKEWTESKELCGTKENGTLISIETKTEFEFIKAEWKVLQGERRKKFPREDLEWNIGLHCADTCKEKDNWRWVNNKALSWNVPRKSGLEGRTTIHCSKIWNPDEGYFDDVSCDTIKFYICEYPVGKCTFFIDKEY